jgi:hypothetical protein
MSGTPTIESTCSGIVEERGPSLLQDLTAEVVRQGRTRARNPELAVSSALRSRPGWYELADGRWTTLAYTLRDVRFAHRLTVDEASTGWVDPHPDFSPLESLPEFPRSWDDVPELGLPTEFLGLPPDAVIVARVDAGRMVLSRASTDELGAPTPGQVAAFAGAARRELAIHVSSALYPGVPLGDLLVRLAAEDPGSFAGALLVVGDLVTAAGLETSAGQVGLRGTDWTARDRFLDDLRSGGSDDPWEDDLDGRLDDWPVDHMPDSAFPRATDRTVDGVSPRPVETPLNLDARRLRRRGRRPAKRCLQLRIRLLDVRPPIWRRILVPATITLDRLHAVVQAAMGWSDMHLHEFQLGRDRWGDVDMDDDGGRLRDEFDVRLRSIVARGDRLRYVYDLGDDWHHEIVVEGEIDGIAGELYPLCVDGAGACPPEDAGGTAGYRDILDALARPRSRRHRDILQWLGGPFDPAEFSIEDVNQRFDLLA